MQRLGTAQSEASLSGSRLSDTRKQKLMQIKAREDLKASLTEKFKNRYTGAGRKADEVSIPPGVIEQEVGKFASQAKVTEANLDRLERRMQHKASKGPGSVVSEYSVAPSQASRSRSVPSLTGQSIVGGGAPQGDPNFDWSKLDDYAAYLHQQDALRQRLGMQALQKKMRGDLDGQMHERRSRADQLKHEETKYHHSAMAELERWKMAEKSRDEERYHKVMKEKRDRDEQLEFERQLKAQEQQQKKHEEGALVQKIVVEMEAEQRRFERKKEAAKQSMKKVFEENLEDQRRRDEQKKAEMEQEALAIKEYNRILDEQEEQRAEEMQARLDRQNRLMKQLQVSVGKVQKEAGNDDMARASEQMEEMDRHFFEAESMKQQRLKQLKLENQAYLLKQAEEKKSRKQEERQLQDIQAQILKHDTSEFHEIERVKQLEKKSLFLEHRKELEDQIKYRQNLSFPTMSPEEMKMNAPLLNLVQRSLAAKEEQQAQQDMEDFEG
jgi:hypothetical protein